MKKSKHQKIVVEVDQSGKIADTQVDTVLAYSNSHSYSILISAKTKRKCLIRLRKLGRTGKNIYIQLFAVGLYLLFESNIDKLSAITIDVEYPGLDATIKQHLYNLFVKFDKKLDKELISFELIGKKSQAHIKAKSVYNKKFKPDLTIEAKTILNLFTKNKKIGGSVRRKT